MVEKSLDIHGDEILYVGDHIFTDVSQSKVHLRWRTALICRELEDEVWLLNFLTNLYKTEFYRAFSISIHFPAIGIFGRKPFLEHLLIL